LKIKLEYKRTEYFANYTDFYLHNVTDKYRLQVGGYEGKIGDSFAGRHNNYQFSTFDEDNDSSTKNCAKARKGGYWYSNCNESNLNGMWAVNRWHGIIWDALNEGKSLTFVQMVVQRK
jgi:ficolin